MVFEELRVPTANSFMKPDLIAVKNGVGTVMDVSIVGDGRAATAWLDKNEKYGTERPLAAIRLALSHVGSPVDRISNQPIILSYRGICYTKSVKALILHGLPRYVISWPLPSHHQGIAEHLWCFHAWHIKKVYLTRARVNSLWTAVWDLMISSGLCLASLRLWRVLFEILGFVEWYRSPKPPHPFLPVIHINRTNISIYIHITCVIDIIIFYYDQISLQLGVGYWYA